jgi:hypothetical protein
MQFAKALAAGLFFLFAGLSTSAQASADERDLRVIATGTTTARVQADSNADRINVKSLGADGNAQGGADGTLGVGGLVFSSKSARFTSDDCKTGDGCTGKNANKAFSHISGMLA